MRRILNILGTPTAISSAIYYFGNFGLSLGRYLFHLLLLRLLLPTEYGEFLAYLSLTYLLAIPNSTISNVVVKFVSRYKGEGNSKAINRFFYHILRRLSPFTSLVGLILIFLSENFATIFKAHPGAFIILGVSVILSPFGILAGSILLALQKFYTQIIISIIQLLLTIGLALLFIKLNYSATGVVASQITAGIIGTIIVIYILRKTIFPPAQGGNKRISIAKYSVYSLVFAIGTLSFISTDVLMVRNLFSEHLSGIYSSLSTLGKMISFGLGPLNTLVLSVASHRQGSTGSSRNVFVKLGLVLIVFGVGATSVFALFPHRVVQLLSGSNYLEAANYLPVFSLSTLIYSTNLFIVSYFMAVGLPQVNKILLLATIAQPTLIYLFHKNLEEVVSINLVVGVVLLLCLACFGYFQSNGKNKI